MHAHAVKVELDTADVEFPGHATQVEDIIAPTVNEYVFTSQFVHAEGPVMVLYLPAIHATQAPSFGPVYPWLQVQPDIPEFGYEFTGQPTQYEEELAPTVIVYLPMSQSVQSLLPILVLYLPATHDVHE